MRAPRGPGGGSSFACGKCSARGFFPADAPARSFGTFVQTRLPLQLYFVSDPKSVEEILVKKPELFRKDRTSRLLARVVGNGLLVNEGESWRRQRRLLQPAFHQRQLQSYAAVMVAAAERAAAGWQAGEVRDVHEAMMAVTLNIVAETLFGADVSGEAGRIGGIIAGLMEEFGRILGLAAMFQPPVWVPTAANRASGRRRASSTRSFFASSRRGGRRRTVPPRTISYRCSCGRATRTAVR